MSNNLSQYYSQYYSMLQQEVGVRHTLNALNAQQGYANQALQPAYGSAYQTHMSQMNATDYENMITQKEAELAHLRAEYEHFMYNEAMKGPSPADLDKFPSLKSIWQELKTTMSLCRVKK